MTDAKWIWINNKNEEDSYGEFVSSFSARGKTTVRIACDGVYNVFLNDELVGFSSCADFPKYKFYDEIDISRRIKKTNELKVVVWHFGVNSQTYINDKAGVIFEVESDGKIVAFSSKDTLSRKMNEYKNGYKKRITSQLGLSFCFDNTVAKNKYNHSVEVDKTTNLHFRPIEKLQIVPSDVKPKITKTENSYLIDLGRETCGFLSIKIDSTEKQKVLFSYGEHIVDNGHVRRLIGDRDFSVEVVLKQGKNEYTNTLRRLAGRYIEVFAKKPVKISYVKLLPVFYPVDKTTLHLKGLDKKIYDVCVDTLRLCMHEHYEDCPWREQALYVMDSRNQALCGYYAFKEFSYPRHNFVLFSKSLRKDGLLSICAPTGNDFPIPFFSLFYIKTIYEYIKYSGDDGILEEVGYALKSIIKTVQDKMDDNGLIASFPYPFWNFYEWTDGSSSDTDMTRKKGDYVKSYDMILNAMYVYVMPMYDEMFGTKTNLSKIKKAINSTFYDKKKGVYKLSSLSDKYSQLANSLAVLIGLKGKELCEKILSDENMIEASLSARAFLYDALLETDKNYKTFILNDIRNKYGKMLKEGATSVWETEKGQADFGNAGSLCHGWSALPVYYYHLFNEKK